MIETSTPLDPTRAAIVRDLYQLAFCRQLTEAGADVRPAEPWHLCDASIAALLYEYAALLRRTAQQADADLLTSMASAIP